MKKELTLLAFLASIGIISCTHEKPPLNAENCKRENIEKLDLSIRRSFADDCFLKLGTVRQNSGKRW